MFIDSNSYIDVFRKKENIDESEYDLYNIFSACHPRASVIDKNSFYLNYSLGNIIIIFDGIDEIISTIPSFNLFKFLDTLEDLRIRLGKGKILINCRDTYIKDLNKYYESKPDNKIQLYDLLGFNEDLARKFFLKHFEDEEYVKSCIKLLKECFPDEKDSEYKYPPFILEIVLQIVTPDFHYEEVDLDFNSEVLQPNETNDVVIYRICNRELIKKEKHGFQLNVDQQVRFLCELAIEEKGKIEQEDFSRLLQNIGVTDRVKEVAKGLYDHPLILKENNHHVFRFDFFNMYFKSIAIFNMLARNTNIRLTDRLINILSTDCNYNSVISNFIISKAKDCEIPFTDCLRNSKEIIQKILKFNDDKSTVWSNTRKKAVSNILTLVLASRHTDFSNEYILNNLFGNEKKEINNLYLIDMPEFAGIEFDLSGFYFSNSEINNYGSFFQCKFDNETYFDETCTISNLYISKINWKNITADNLNFDRNIKGDNSIFRVMNIKKSGDTELRKYFRDYLATFYRSREFQPVVSEKAIKAVADEYVTVSHLTKILQDNGIVYKYENGNIYIDEKLKFKIIRYLGNGLPFPQLSRSLIQLKNLLLTGKLK